MKHYFSQTRASTVAGLLLSGLSFIWQPAYFWNQSMNPFFPAQAYAQDNESSAASVLSVAAALVKAEDFLGENRNWHFPQSAALFAEAFPMLRTDLPQAAAYLNAAAQRGGVDQINRFLQEKNFSVTLAPVDDPQGIACAAVVDLKVEWQTPGTKQMLFLPQADKWVSGVHLAQLKAVYRAAGHEHLIAELTVKGDAKFFITRCDSSGSGHRSLASAFLAAKLAQVRRVEGAAQFPGGIIFPAADLRDSTALSWLIGARTTDSMGQPAIIVQALSQVRFSLNEIGARGQAAAAASMVTATGEEDVPQQLVIDGPYLAWFELPGAKLDRSIVTFAAHVNVDKMTPPDSLD